MSNLNFIDSLMVLQKCFSLVYCFRKIREIKLRRFIICKRIKDVDKQLVCQFLSSASR
jgi:hypothetical protein